MLILRSTGSDMRHFRDRNFHGSSHDDDATLWVLVQRVGRREDERARRLHAAEQLQDFVKKPENRQALSRNLDSMLNSLIDVFFERSGTTLQKEVAVVIALVGQHLANEYYPFFQWLLHQFQSIANDNVKNYLLESLNKLLEYDLEERKFGKVIGMLMDELQAALENIDSPEHLPTCINPLIIIAQNYQGAFTKHFRDTVDILVGWHIDHTQPMTLTLFASESLIKLHAHWLTDLQFSLTLLSQFLEDMEAYAEDFHKLQNGEVIEDDSISADACLHKMAALMRVFSTVVRSIGPVFHANNGPPITEPFILDALQRIIFCAQLADDTSGPVTHAADECARLLLGAVQWRGEDMLSESLLTYAVHAVERSRSEARLLLVLDFTTVMVQEVGSALPAWFVQGLLGPSSRLLSLKHSRNPKLCSELLALYQACLAVKSVPLLQTSYKHVTGELQHAINNLLEIHAPGQSVSLQVIVDNPFVNGADHKSADEKQSVVSSSREEKLIKTATFDITALLEVADAKHSLIGMYALSPSIFDLLHSTLKVVHSHLATRIPSLQYVLLNVLYSHCQRHKNFLSSFLGGTPATLSDTVGGSFMDNVTMSTHTYYPSILELIAKHLIQKNTSEDTRSLLLHWSQEILERLKTIKDSSVLGLPALYNLVQSLVVIASRKHLLHSKKAARCLHVLVAATSSVSGSSSSFAKALQSSTTRCCFTQIKSTDVDSQKTFMALLLSIAVDKVLELSFQDEINTNEAKAYRSQHCQHKLQKILTSYGQRQSWSAKRMIAGRPTFSGHSSFHSHQFKSLIEKILKPSYIEFGWLERLCWSSERRGASTMRSSLLHSRTIEYVLPTMATFDQSFLHWWALWSAAEYTVANKLRTSLGRPQDTFQKIEGAIRELCEQKSPSSVRLGKVKDTGRAFLGLSSSVIQHPHLLLQFFDSLEKLLYNASEGCAVSIAPPSKAVRNFFYTNKKTCEQWLNCLRLAVMKLALSCGLPALTFQHGQMILHDMKAKNNSSGLEFESAVAMTTEALIELSSPHSVEGLYRWCRDLGSTKQWAWMKAAKLDSCHSYEDAAKEYKQILTTHTKKQSNGDSASDKDTSKKVFNPARTLITKRLVKCYTELRSWEELQAWLKQNSSDDIDSRPSALSTSLDFIKTLSSFDQLELPAASKKSSGLLSNLSLKATSSPPNGAIAFDQKVPNWSDLMNICELQTISAVGLLVDEGSTESSPAMVERLEKQAVSIASCCMKLSFSSWPPSLNEDFFTLFATATAIKKALEEKSVSLPLVLSENIAQGEWLVGSASSRLLSTMENVAQKDAKIQKHVSNLRVAMVKSHRKHGNYSRAQSLLLSEIKKEVEIDSSDVADLHKICDLNLNSSSPITLALRYESAKLLHALGRADDSLLLLAQSVATYLKNGVKSNGVLCSRALLTLVKYLQADWKNTGNALKDILSTNCSEPSDESLLSKFRLLLNAEKSAPLAFANNAQLIAEVNHEIVVGSLLNLATIQAPNLAKSWFTMAGWCYKWGRKIMDNASTAGSVELTSDEKEEVENILSPLGVDSDDLEDVYSVLRKAHCNTASIQVDDDALDDISAAQEGQSHVDLSQVVLEQLNTRCGSWLSRASPRVCHALLAVWQRVCARLFAQYRVAAQAYFKFLNLNVGEQAALKYEDSNVTATLRLLRLLVKHALELQTTLKNGLSTTPTAPWKGIIPQLFSRLNHPETYVRRSIAGLLCRVARQSPHLIVYPVVVATMRSDPRAHSALGASLEEQEDIADDEDAEVDGFKQDDPIDNGALNSCYNQVLQALLSENDAAVRDVQLLVAELRRITLLWDELWLGTLNQHHHDIMRRLQQLQDEAKRVNTNSTLTKQEKEAILREQQQAIMRPVTYALRRVQMITSTAAETPHECWFAENVQPLIVQALEQLLKPSDPHTPQSCWSGFKQVHSLLQNRASKRASHILTLNEISPRLMNLKPTAMSMPGVADSSHLVTIEGCSSTVTVLPTKTKPKKLQFIGSDGRRYTYLFKGLEDLHLDERIMQFLSIANRLLRRQHESRGYVARHYSVTPLGPRSGLIQWVSGATPLFLLYKKWQQRQALVQAQKAASGTTVNAPANIQILRPSDIYYNKLNPAMKKAEVDMDRISRKDWPIDVLRTVLEDLIQETPDDLLQKELWCSATGASEYWNMQQKYSQSTAVMSMIGYVIGLGDRHLDNVLIDLETGEVVHIDYNVCFEKGLQLRVPEKVPFRLTQNLHRALGLTGVEGVFRNSCEQVLSTLRKGRETLLTLLEAFVYDPLVDWTGTVEGGYAGAVYGGGGQQTGAKGEDEDKLSKKDMEREITRSLFSSRVAEMKQGWFTNRDEMLKALPALVEKLNDYKKHFKNNVELNENIENFLEVKSQVKSAMSDSRHPFTTLPQRWHQHQQQQKKQEITLNAMQDKIMVCEENLKQYEDLLATLQSPELASLLAEATSQLELGPSAYEHASKFLHSAGQANMVSQAQSTDKELVSIGKQRRHAMQSCLDVLSQYAAVVAHFPPQGALACHNMSLWRKRLEMMVDGFLNNDCSVARSEIDRSRSKDALLTQSRAASVKDSALQRESADLNAELLKLIDRRNHEPVAVSRTSDAERMVKTSRDHIVAFVQEHGIDGLRAFTGVLAMLLCALDQSAIAMETTAAGAGHRLVDMTSKEGDWFLEELCGLFANIVQLLHLGDSLLNGVVVDKDGPSIAIREATRVVICADSVFRSLWELYNNFRNIIVPEAVKLLQCEEPSVVELVTAVSGILQGKRLEELTKQLSSHLRNQGLQNGVTSSFDDVLAEVHSLQAKYNQLLQDSRQKRTDEQRLTAGQMLLQAFDGLFRSVFNEFNALLNARNRLYSAGLVPINWRYVDVLNKPLQLQKFKNLSDSTTCLQALLFVKQLQAMHDFFALCQSNVRAFVVDRTPSSGKGISGHHYMGSKNLYTEERLAIPTKHFISYLVQELLIGIPSEMLGCTMCGLVQLLGVDLVSFASANSPVSLTEDMCKAAIDSKFSQNFISKPTMLIYHFNRAWKEYDRAQRLDTNIVAVQASLQRAQLQVTRFQWLHEDLLSLTGNSPLSHRRNVVNDLNKRMTTLQHLDNMLHQLQDKASNQITSIQQRLKWAAGANPTLQTVLSSVETDSQKRAALLKKESDLSLRIIEICEGASVFEQTRLASSRDSNSESEYMKLVDSCEALSKSICSSPVKIDSQERTAVETLPPKQGTAASEWLPKVSEKLHACVGKFRHQRQQEESRMLLVKSNLRDLVTSVKQLLSSHGRLLSDVKTLLKTMAKEEDKEGEGELDKVGSVRKYMERYKELTSSLNDALKDVLQGCDVSTMLDPDPLIERLMEIAGTVDGVYEDLVAFANPYLEASRNQPTFASALRGSSFASQSRSSPNTKRPSLLPQLPSELQSTTTPSTPPPSGPEGGGSGVAGTGGSATSKSATAGPSTGVVATPKKKVRDPRTGKAIQERNSFALSVWWKVKSKLDGKDQDTGKRMLVTEQVDRVITEATSFDNLALLYEGWTAWV